MKRELTFDLVRLRSDKAADKHTISGYAALYGVRSHPIYHVYDAEGKRVPVREQLAPGAFDDAVGPDADVTSNINHDDDHRLLGRTLSGTLKLQADSLGLAFETVVPDTSYARDLGVLMDRGDIRECSFAFTVEESDIERTVEADHILETIKRIKRLYDVAVVTRGAYPQPFSVFRELPKDGETFTIQDLAFRYSQDATADATRAALPPNEPTALRTQQEHNRTLEAERLALTVQQMEAL
jgi:HK97 family phage prohead protease